jgi:ATP-dependent exoDNAse (exonuclease V) beta subunit
MIECPEPGIYKEIPEADYRLWDATNQSLLTTVAQNSLKQARYEQLHQKDPTAAMIFGTRCHTFLLEPEDAENRFYAPLDLPRRSNEQKETWAKYEAQNAGKDMLKPEQILEFRAMSAAMHARPDWRELWENRLAVELCVVWDDDETGLRCKCRIDLVSRYQGTPVVVDYKTTKNASSWSFGRSVHDYGYDIQAAHYLAAADSIAPGERVFVLAAQEKTPPHDAMLHALAPTSLESGRLRWRQSMRQWAAALEDDDFPGYRYGVSEVEMPSYAINLTLDGSGEEPF